MTSADIFRAMGDPVRVRLFHLLSLHDEVCVCRLTEAVELPQSTVSRHLAILRHAGLVDTRRDGKWVHYRLTGAMVPALASLVNDNADDTLHHDAQRLASTLQNCD